MASMSILDDAIREHLELKRAHGADEAEIKRLEDEAFGPPGRPDEPDPLAEAPTEFMTQPEAPAAAESAETGEESGARRVDIADLQEPPAEPAEPQEEPRIEATESVEAPQANATPLAPAEDPVQAAPPAEEEPPAIEHEAAPEAEAPAAEPAEDAASEPVADAGHSTEERHAIAEQPTELFDVESEMGTEDAPAAEISASRAEPTQPPTTDGDYDEDEEFWSDQRLSEELDNALEAPLTEEHPAPAPLTDEHEAPAPSPPTDEHDTPAPTAAPAPPLFDQKEDAAPAGDEREEKPEHDVLEPKEPGHEDVLEDTPDFLEDAPEDDELWFEQRPPKDFDLD
jgi:hypothetical protein